MMAGWFGRSKAPPASLPPPGTIVYAIGDIHGRLDLLERLEAAIEDDAGGRPNLRPVVVFLGDYVDRGPRPAGVVAHLAARADTAGRALRVHLMGNHEDAMLRFLEDASIIGAWLDFGGGTTLADYGVTPPDPRDARDVLRAQDELRAALPAAHLAFLRGLLPCYGAGDYFFAHAGVRPGVPLGAQATDDLFWIRDEFLNSRRDFGKVVVHGHTITAEPVQRANRIGVDTGAYHTNRLTAVVLEGTERRFLAT